MDVFTLLNLILINLLLMPFLQATFRLNSLPDMADVFIIAVPTPFRSGTNGILSPTLTLSFLQLTSIASVLRSPATLCCWSQLLLLVPPRRWLRSLSHQVCGLTIDQLHIAYCPERVLPGCILRELVSNDRVIGGLTAVQLTRLLIFYGSFCHGELLATNSRTAELVKLAENSFRDVNIAFANELSLVCDYLDINVRELIRLANHHPRVNVLQPGCGVGGHCIAVDPWFIVAAASHCTPLIQAARQSMIVRVVG